MRTVDPMLLDFKSPVKFATSIGIVLTAIPLFLFVARWVRVNQHPVHVANSVTLSNVLIGCAVDNIPITPTKINNLGQATVHGELLDKSCTCFDVILDNRTLQSNERFTILPGQSVRIYLPLGGERFPGGMDVAETRFRFQVDGYPDRLVKVSRTVRGHEPITVTPTIVTLPAGFKTAHPPAKQTVAVALMLSPGVTPGSLICPVGTQRDRMFRPHWKPEPISPALVRWRGQFDVSGKLLSAATPGTPHALAIDVLVTDDASGKTDSVQTQVGVLVNDTRAFSHPEAIEALSGSYPQSIQLVANDKTPFAILRVNPTGPIRLAASVRSSTAASSHWIDLVFESVEEPLATPRTLRITTDHPGEPMVIIPIHAGKVF